MVPGLLDTVARWLNGPEAAPAPTPAAPAAPAIPSLSVDDPRLPSASRERMARLIALIADIEARGDADPGSATAHAEVRQMRDVHVPALIASYAEIPPAHRAEFFRRNGRSASYDLNAGFDRLIERLEVLSRALAQDNLDSFADNLRFIETRYGGTDPLS